MTTTFLLVLILGGVPGMDASTAKEQDPPLPADGFHEAVDPNQSSGAAPDYNRDIRPILAANCVLCHGFDPGTREAGLRLDLREDAIAPRGGRPGVIVPGKPDESELLARIAAHDPVDRMPPDDRTPLSADEIDLIRRWIAAGAPYDQHWSLKPISDPPAPSVADDSWPRDDVDRFVLARLKSADLSPAPPADKRTLLRRATFDLIGLPPTPDEIDAFLNDGSSDAYDRVVHRLLASPHFGERWGRHWLDLMRYAETHGHEFDYPIKHAWQYRDYIIRALNADVPYDEFVIEHLAGDLLPTPRMHATDGFNESIIGTGWWWLSQGTHAPVDVRADEAERMDNQIDVLSKSFLGLTVSCARCHDHKFDPITQQDYYALAGYIQSSRRQEAFLDVRGRIGSGVEQLLESRDETTSLIQSVLAGVTEDQLSHRIAAANEALHGAPQPGDESHPSPVVLFEDFEGDTYDGWTVEGTAFGPGPYTQQTLAEYQGDVGAHGRGFVNTHNTRNGEDVAGGDDHVGRMVSRPFEISHASMTFLIAGGAHPGRTCMNLVLDGEIVRTATGHNSNQFRRDHWDVTEFIGREAHLEIIDEQRGSWGQIGIDRIAFAPSGETWPETSRPISAVAAEQELEQNELLAWVRALSGDALDRLDLAESPLPEAGNFVATFDDEAFGEWATTGQAFGAAPGQIGNRVGTMTNLLDAGAAHSGLLAPRLQGALRSPTFELTGSYLNYRVRGTGGRIRLVIDGYFLDDYNPLLFDGMTFPVDNADEWRIHHQHILDKYIGHRAYIEILDEGDGWIAVDWIVTTSEPIQSTPSDTVSPDRIAAHLGESIQCTHEGACTHPSHVIAVDWLIGNELLPQPSVTVINDALAAERRIADALASPMRVLAMTDGTPEDEYVFIRGNHRQPGPLVPRRSLSVLNGELDHSLRSSGRLELAEQLFRDDNPLTARVVVNRAWHHVFGAPLVPTTDDFGMLGQSPTHPELLDHLATWFRTDADWSVKRLLRKLVLSETYRMSSDAQGLGAESVDPTNALLHRMNVKRLEGEAIRDAALAISGRLDPAMFGPPVPLHLTPFLQGRGRPGESGPVDGHGRRSIYLEVRRNFLSPMMLAFDAPVPHSTVGRRGVSNVPAQALILMNDPLIVEQSKRWAANVLRREAVRADERIDLMYVQAFGRLPRDHERQAAIEFLQAHGGNWEADAEAWADLAHVFFNVKEFIFVR